MKRIITSIFITLFSLQSFACQTVQESQKKDQHKQDEYILRKLEKALEKWSKTNRSTNAFTDALNEYRPTLSKDITNSFDAKNTNLLHKKYHSLVAYYHIVTCSNDCIRYGDWVNNKVKDENQLRDIANVLSACPNIALCNHLNDTAFKTTKNQALSIVFNKLKQIKNNNKISDRSQTTASPMTVNTIQEQQLAGRKTLSPKTTTALTTDTGDSLTTVAVNSHDESNTEVRADADEAESKYDEKKTPMNETQDSEQKDDVTTFALRENEPFMKELSQDQLKKIYDSRESIDLTVVKQQKHQAKLIHQVANDGKDWLAEIILSIHPDMLNNVDKYGDSPLHYAISNNKTNTISLLLDKGATTSNRNSYGENALTLAVSFNNTDIVELLITHKGKNRADINGSDNKGSTPLMRAVLENDPDMVAMLLKYNPKMDVKNHHGEDVFAIAQGAFENFALKRHTKDQSDDEIEALNTTIIDMLYNHVNKPYNEQKQARIQEQKRKAKIKLKKAKKQVKKAEKAAAIAQAEKEHAEQAARAEQEAQDAKKQEEKSKNQSRQRKKAQREEERQHFLSEQYEKNLDATAETFTQNIFKNLALMRTHKAFAHKLQPFKHKRARKLLAQSLNRWKQRTTSAQETRVMIDELTNNEEKHEADRMEQATSFRNKKDKQRVVATLLEHAQQKKFDTMLDTNIQNIRRTKIFNRFFGAWKNYAQKQKTPSIDQELADINALNMEETKRVAEEKRTTPPTNRTPVISPTQPVSPTEFKRAQLLEKFVRNTLPEARVSVANVTAQIQPLFRPVSPAPESSENKQKVLRPSPRQKQNEARKKS